MSEHLLDAGLSTLPHGQNSIEKTCQLRASWGGEPLRRIRAVRAADQSPYVFMISGPPTWLLTEEKCHGTEVHFFHSYLLSKPGRFEREKGRW